MDHARARRALVFGARMFVGLLWWELVVARVRGDEVVTRGRMRRMVTLAQRFRGLALDLGGVWIKLGQFISSRVDVVPKPVVDVLADLQDAVPAEANTTMMARIAEELGKPVNHLFEEIEPEPIAAASFGQAYRAVMMGERVIIKVQRPDLDALVETDLNSLKRIIGWFKAYKPLSARADLDALVAEFAEGVRNELDYVAEGHNAVRFAQNFARDPQVRVPRILQSTRRVLILENVEEIKITDYDGLAAAGVNRVDVARKLFDTYLQQFFVHGFFHADPHPGNLFVQPLDLDTARATKVPIPATGRPFRLVFIDFGMVGAVPEDYEHELREAIIAMSLKDARRVTGAMQRMRMFLPAADMFRVEQAVTAVFDRFWGLTTTDLTNVDFKEMRGFADEFSDLLRDLPFQMPQNMLYLGRAANILSGMSTGLDAGFNPWRAVQPFAQGLAGDAARKNSRGLLAEVLQLGRKTVQLPNQADQFLGRALSGQLELRAQLSANSTNELRRIERSVNQLRWALVLMTVAGCGTLLLINGLVLFGALLLGVAGLVLVKLMLT